MKIKTLLLALGALVSAVSVSAQDVSPNDPSRVTVLHQGLLGFQATEAGTANSDQYFETALSMGYLNGVVDALYGTNICPPPGVTRSQNAHIVLKYLDDHPGEWQLGSPTMIVRAFKSVFPCPRSAG